MLIDAIAIYQLQKEKNITGRQLSDLSGIKPESLSRIKRKNKAAPITAQAIARALGVDLAAILPKENESNELKGA